MGPSRLITPSFPREARDSLSFWEDHKQEVQCNRSILWTFSGAARIWNLFHYLELGYRKDDDGAHSPNVSGSRQGFGVEGGGHHIRNGGHSPGSLGIVMGREDEGIGRGV